MLLNHPLTNLQKEAKLVQNSNGEYTKIIFQNDGFIVTDESYIYDILFEAKVITAEDYNNKFWENIIHYVNE